MTTPNRLFERRVSRRVQEIMTERDGLLPVWIRAPKSGPEHYTGLSRSKLFNLASEGHIRSVSLKDPGQIKGVRLFHLGSVLSFIDQFDGGDTVSTAADA